VVNSFHFSFYYVKSSKSYLKKTIIVYYFLTTLPKVQTTEVSSQASRVLSCAGATFDVKVRNCNLLNGLVLWLPMDEGSGTIAYDYSGNRNNGTLYNGPTWVDGKIGKAISFDGNDDVVVIGGSYSLNSPLSITGTSISIATWIKRIGDALQTREQIVEKNPTCNGYDFAIERATLTPSVRFGFGGACVVFNTVSSILNNQWYHLAGTYDGNQVKLYINGNLDKVYSETRSISWGNRELAIGRNRDSLGWGLNGTIDELRIYNRALSEEEIKELYYNGLTNKFNITIGLLNLGFADLGKSFNAIVYLKNGTILQLPLVLNRDLTKGSYLEKTLTIDGYYPSYGLVDKIMVCSNDCQGVCYEVNVNNQC
jgi:hypothetical protein